MGAQGDPLGVLSVVVEERQYQDIKWHGNPHEVGSWILIMESCLEKAKRAWMGPGGSHAALHEIRQVAAVAVACMEQHGAPHRGEG